MKGDCTMRKLFESANRYAADSNWQILSLLKICLFSAGILAGLAIPRRRRKGAALAAVLAFAATYIPLMVGFLPYLAEIMPEGRSQRRVDKAILPED